MKRYDIKYCLELLKKMFTVLLGSIVNASKHTKCLSLSNQKCKIQPILINLHPMYTIKNFTSSILLVVYSL